MSYYHIHALIPIYTTTGENATLVIHLDGSSEKCHCTLQTYIRRMLYQAHLDPQSLKYWTSKVLGEKLNTPLILSDTLVFIPIKMRQAIGRTDGCFGYVLSNCILTYDDHTLTLTSGQTLTTLSTKSYVAKKQRDACLLRYAYLEHRKQHSFMID
ncbi:MAG: hypothetical protein ACRCWY_06330 [Cellulosilyticaceae bacterium]